MWVAKKNINYLNEALIDATVFQYLNTEFVFTNFRLFYNSNKVRRADFLTDSTASVLRSALHM